MPKIRRANQIFEDQVSKKGKTIDSYFRTIHCFVCHIHCEKEICSLCLANIPVSIGTLSSRIRLAEKRYGTLQDICRSCTGHSTSFDADSACISIDCPIYFKRRSQLDKVRLGSKWTRTINELGQNNSENIRWFDF
jgi:DNA polymerase zeta